ARRLSRARGEALMAITVIAGELECPVCGETHRVTPQTALVQDARVGTRELRAGDPIEPVLRDYTLVQPRTGDTLRVLEDGWVCEDDRVWTEVTVERGRIAALALTRCDAAVIDRIHGLPGAWSAFPEWVRALPDPVAWNPALATTDNTKHLRLRVMLRE